MAKQAEPSHLPPPQVPSSPLPSSSAPQHNTSTPSTPPQVTGSSRDWLGHWAIARRAAQVSVDLLRLDVRVGRGSEEESTAEKSWRGCMPVAANDSEAELGCVRPWPGRLPTTSSSRNSRKRRSTTGPPTRAATGPSTATIRRTRRRDACAVRRACVWDSGMCVCGATCARHASSEAWCLTANFGPMLVFAIRTCSVGDRIARWLF